MKGSGVKGSNKVRLKSDFKKHVCRDRNSAAIYSNRNQKLPYDNKFTQFNLGPETQTETGGSNFPCLLMQPRQSPDNSVAQEDNVGSPEL